MASSNALTFFRPPADGETGVAEAVRTNPTLEYLWIDGTVLEGWCWFEDDDAVELGQALASHESLKGLHLLGCMIAPRGLRVIAEALKPSKTLASLFLSSNPNIGDAGAETVADLLVSNSSLKTLVLEECGVGADRSTAIAVALKTNTVLTCLHMGSSLPHMDSRKIGDAGATALADALASNPSLKELRLIDCGVCTDGSRAIALALKTNTVLEILDMSMNHCGDAGATALADALASSASLRFLHLDSDSYMGEEGALALGRAVGANLALATDSIIRTDSPTEYKYRNIIPEEALRVRAFTLRRREQLLAFGMAMIPRLAAGKETQEGAPGTSREALPFDRMDRDVFKLIGEAYGHY